MENQELQLAKQTIIAACEKAKNLSLLQNAAAAFEAASVVKSLRDALTPEIMEQFFMPLMNTRIGFLTDKDPGKGYNGEPYDARVVREALIDALSLNLLPLGNQMNIIAGRMYPTKEGYTALLKNMGVKYRIYIGTPKFDESKDHAQMEFSIGYSINGGEEEKFRSAVSVSVNKNKAGYIVSSEDQLKGKAERRAKKQLYEMISGLDLGEAADAESAPIDLGTAKEIKDANIEIKVAKEIKRIKESKAVHKEPQQAVAEPQGILAEKPLGEAAVTVAADHKPFKGIFGTWMVWDEEKQDFVDSGKETI